MANNKELYVLISATGGSRGVYTSTKSLRKGVDYWMRRFPYQTLSYEKVWSNTPSDPIEWEWCYIALNDTRRRLLRGGGVVPHKNFWGINLVGMNLELISPKEK